jgi:iron complex outermembrane receptor protein
MRARTPGLLALCVAGSSHAQISAPTLTAEVSEVVVTAQRREERAQEVPIVISVFSPERLQQQDVSEAQDLQATVPSLVVGNNGNPSREAQSFTIRGQGATFQASPGVVVYMNEVPLPAAISTPQQGGPGNFVDLENVQVLNGPQGTLFGRNTTGGAVLLTPRKPTNQFEGYAQAQLGNFENQQVEGVVNLPIAPDKVLLRLAGAYQDREGYTQDVVWNTDRDNAHWYSGRAGLTLRPSDNLDIYTMVYGASSKTHGAGLVHRAFNIEGLQSLGFCYEGPTIPGAIASCDVYRASDEDAAALGPRRTAHGVNSFQETDTWGIVNTATYDLSDTLTLRNIAGYQRFKTAYSVDSDATIFHMDDGDPRMLPGPGQVVLPGDLTPVTYFNAMSAQTPRDHLEVVTEELQLQGEALDKRLNYTIGGFFYDQRPAGLQGANAIGFCPAVFTGLCEGYTIRYAIKNESKALYAQATLDLGAFQPALENLKVTAGYRYTWDKVGGSANLYAGSAQAPGVYTCLADNSMVSDAAECQFSAELRTSAPTWNIGVDYAAGRNLLLYAKASRGYKSGGVNANAVFTTTRTFTPEFVTSYEAGFKSDFALVEMPARLNAAYYYLDYKDIQRATGDFNPTTGAGGAQILQADAKIQGVEVEALIRPFSGVEIGGTFSYTDAEYKKYEYQPNVPVQDCTGGLILPGQTAVLTCLPFQYVSPRIYSVYLSAERPLKGDLGTISLFLNYAHSSAQHTEATVPPPGQPGEHLEAFGTLNLSIDWRNVAGSQWDVGLYATNLTDELYRVSNSNVFPSQLYHSTLYGEPRMYGVRVRYSFSQ